MNLVDPDGRKLVKWYKENGHLVPYCYNGGECNSSNSFVQAVVTAYHYNIANCYFAGCSGKSQTEIAVERKEQINVIIADLVGDRYIGTLKLEHKMKMVPLHPLLRILTMKQTMLMLRLMAFEPKVMRRKNQE